MKKHLLLLLLAGLSVLPNKVFAQLSPSGQMKVITPSVLSACAADTIWVELTNKNGPTCTAGSAAVPDAQVAITIPGNGEITYQSASVGGGGATEVSYTGNVLTMDIPVPGFGATTRSWFVLNSTCEVTGVSLPSLNLSATYPAAFNTAPESWEGAQMNTGIGQITFVQASSSQNTIISSFGATSNTASYIYNTGFGKITKLTYHQIVHDSLMPSLGATGKDHIYLRRRFINNTANGILPAFSQKFDQYPNGTITNLGNGYREYSFDIEGEFLDRTDGSLDPGDGLQVNAGYFRMPTTCMDDMLQKQWVTYECAGGGATCNTSVDTLTRVYRISAGIPVIGGLNSNVEAWDGCTNKTGSFTFKNTGIPDPADSNVSVAFDVDLELQLGGIMYIDNLTLGGVSLATTPATPGAVNKVSWNLKDQNTVDFDGPGGIEDLDGDGFYDDIRPGDSVDVSFTYTVDGAAACGSNLDYSIKAVSSFTDYCRELDGSGSTTIYSFGFSQTAPVSQVTPLPDYGSPAVGEINSRQAQYNFNYEGINLNTANAVAKLRINYSKIMTIQEPIVFLGNTIPLTSFTQVGTGGLDTTGYANTTDVDSALEYTLTAADITALLDNSSDALSYYVALISCDSFQTQTNTDGFQILFQINNSPCPAPNTAPPMELDLACNTAFAYKILSTCPGPKPCYVVVDTIYREAITGFTDENETTGVTPNAAATSKFYEGDTLTFLRTAQLSADYPVMEPIGSFPGSGLNDGLTSSFSFSYNKPVDVPITSLPYSMFEFIPTLSRLRVYDTTTNTLLYDVPLEYHHFAAVSGPQGKGAGNRNSDLYLWTNTTNSSSASYLGQPDINSTPGHGLGDYWCGINYLALDPSACPYWDARYRSVPSITYGVMSNEAENRVSERFELIIEDALNDASVVFDPGYSKYFYEIDTKWRVNPDFPIDNTGGLRERGYITRTANTLLDPPAGTRMNTCGGVKEAIATPATKELTVDGPRRSYDATCGLTIENKLFFNSPVGDFFPGEVRVPFKMDSIVVEMPTEYNLTAAPTFAGTAMAPANSITNSATTGHIVFTNNTANSGTTYMDFPRFSDADGQTTVWNVSYPISNVGTDNFITESYKVPVTYYLRDESGNTSTLIDTFIISESTPAITVAPLGGAVQINDGGACADSYMDVLVSNNTIYGGDNVFIAAESNPNVTVVGITDSPDDSPANPITSANTNMYGTNNYYAELGGMAGGDRRIVRIFFNTTSCNDSLILYTNFGCNYPTNQEPDVMSPTLDSAFIAFNSVDPGIMSGPIDGNKDIIDLCTIQTLEIEVRNVKNANLTNILAGIKLPANAVYVANSAEIAYPSDDYVAATGVTLTGTDSVTIDISADLNLATACGLPGADETGFSDATLLSNTNPPNVVKVRFDIDFNACPTTTSDPVIYDISAANYCGTEVTSSGVFNLIYIGSTTPNTYSCNPANNDALQICADSGVANAITDSMWVKNETGPATTGIGSTLEIVVASDTSLFDIANYSVAAPWTAPVITTNAEGRTVLTFTVPSGIAAGDSTLLILSYDLTPKVYTVCSQGTTDCASLSHSATFYSQVLVECAAKGLTCTALAEEVRGDSYLPKSLECCVQGLGNYVWLDANEDGIQDPSESGVAGVTVTLYAADGITVIATTTTDSTGYYTFEDLPVGDYIVGFSNFPAGSTPTQSNGGINDSTNSDMNPSTGFTSLISIGSGEYNPNVDAGIYFGAPLPVDGLIATKATVQSRNNCKVQWYTIAELNTDRFIIERSKDATIFQEVGTVKAGGATSSKMEYVFNDNIADVQDANILYYRIKLKDVDGQETYSNVISTDMILFDEVAVYPSPFENTFTVSLNVKRATVMGVQLTDVTGRTVLTNSYRVDQGNSEFVITDLESLASGTYYLKVTNQASKLDYVIKVQKK